MTIAFERIHSSKTRRCAASRVTSSPHPSRVFSLSAQPRRRSVPRGSRCCSYSNGFSVAEYPIDNLCTPASLKQPHETPFHFTLHGVFVHVNPVEDIPLEAPEECGHITVGPQLSASRMEMSIHVTLPLGALVGELVHCCVEATPSLKNFYIRHSISTLRFPRSRLS